MLRLVFPALAIFLIATGTARSADPLDYMPASTRVVAVVDHPRKLAETITSLEAFKKAQTLAQVQQVYDSPTVRRLLKLLEFAEKELGAQWPELLDQVAGNGLAFGLQFGPDPPPAIAVVSGTDQKQVEKAFNLGLKVLDAELTRQGGKEQLKTEQHEGITLVHLGTDFHFARAGSIILASNNADFLTEALARGHAKAQDDTAIRKARKDSAKVLPKDPLAWIWLDFAAVKESKASKDFFDSTRQDFVQTIAAGSTIDCLRRSDFVTAGLYQEATGFRLRVRLPAGREGLWSDLAVHIPPKGSPGSLPLLEPPGTIYSQSFHLDIGYAWKNRERLIMGDIRKQLDMAEKAASKFLPSDVPLGELLEMWGPYHRIVVADHDQRPYKTEPGLKLPAFGYVATMRDKKFGANAESIARAAALLGTLQFGMKSTEVEHEGVTITGYRFPENKEMSNDPQRVRFNFEPCFAVVGDELIVASTIELGKKLITELKKPRQSENTAVWRAKVSAANGSVILAGEPDSLITDAVLGRGVGLTEARKEVAKLVDWIRTLGTAQITIDLTATEYQLDIVWTPGKK